VRDDETDEGFGEGRGGCVAHESRAGWEFMEVRYYVEGGEARAFGVEGDDGVDEGLFGFRGGEGARWVVDLPERHGGLEVFVGSGPV